MKKLKVLIIGICLLFVCMLSSCSGYNSTMIKHLSNINNYSTYNVIINDISFFNYNSDIIYIDVIFLQKKK